MFKRVERKRKRRQEDDELGLDEDTKGALSLVDTDSDESDSDDSDADADMGQDRDPEEEDAASKEEGSDEEPPISVEEALKNPIYLISLDPTAYGCVLCKGKLIKSVGMSVAHKNANLHKRRFERFKQLAAQVDPHSDAWQLLREIRSVPNVQREEPQGLSKRALKRRVRQATIREKKQRYRDHKAEGIAMKALKKLSMAGETIPTPSTVNSRGSPLLQNQQRKTRKKQKVESNTSTNPMMRTREVKTKLASRTTSNSGKKSVLKPRLKGLGRAAKSS